MTGDAAKMVMDVAAYRLFVGDWFKKLAVDAGVVSDETSWSATTFTYGDAGAFHATAEILRESPFLKFASSDPARENEIQEIAAKAFARASARDFGTLHWYSTTIGVPEQDSLKALQSGAFLELLGNQVRIVGWRRTGPIVLEFTEVQLPEGTSLAAFAPAGAVHMHMGIPAPCDGRFSQYIANSSLEVTAAICTFALGRPTQLPLMVNPSATEMVARLSERQADPAILTLARKGISLDILSYWALPGGADAFARLRAAFLTYDAAVKQEHSLVACLLYVVVAECIATPNADWSNVKVTKRFVEFFSDLMPQALDQLVAHGNFEELFGIKRGKRSPKALRRELLGAIYNFRSRYVHTGLRPNFTGFASLLGTEAVRRGVFAEFAEAAILSYIQSPRCSIIGHPKYTEPEGPPMPIPAPAPGVGLAQERLRRWLNRILAAVGW
ncbi:MAG: hypothetical protein JSS29_01540 [Proteobacteria bacterium]|nr:hypothetical protein [Pseudomonadota bacterium]